MKRKDLIVKLVNEGFNEKTLSKLNDKQIVELSERIIGEQTSSTSKGAVIMKKGTNPTDIKRVIDTGMNVELREKKEKEGELNVVDTLKTDEINSIWDHIKGGEKPSKREMKMDIFKYMKKHDCSLGDLKKKCLKESQLEINKWVTNLAETNYHTFTSKEEIMELIKVKLNESIGVHETGRNVTRGHNGIPEWFSSKTIKGNETSPTIAPPKTKPGTKPKRRNPYQPGPGPNPRPDASMEVGEQKTAPTIAPPKTKPGTKPKRRNPYQPGPGPNPRPDAMMEVSKQKTTPSKTKPSTKSEKKNTDKPGAGLNSKPEA